MSTGLVIGVPHLETRPVALDWAFAFKSLVPPINYNTVFSVVKNKPVADARNMIADEAINSNAKYLFFLGDDVIVPPHTLRQLIYRMEQDDNLVVCGGVYCSKSHPAAPLVFKENGKGTYWDWKVGEFFEVTGLGMDCTIIRTDIFKELEKPYFRTVDTDQFLDGVNKAEMWTEDLYFLNKVTALKKKVMCDASIICQHIDVFSGTIYALPTQSLPMRRLSKNGHSKKAVDLGCGPHYVEFEDALTVRVDIDERWKPDYRCDVKSLPFATGEYDIVYSSHVLEHMPRAQHLDTITEWVRVMKDDGELRLVLPNIKWAAEKLVKDEIDNHVMNVLYGGQSSPYDFHYNGFTKTSLTSLLNGLGLEVTKYEEQGYNMIVTARRSNGSNDTSVERTALTE